jgi:hypothetical protein
MPVDYTSWYSNARAELDKLQEERVQLKRTLDECDKHIAALVQTVNALAPLVGEEPIAPPPPEDAPAGMTDCVRKILAEAAEPLSASDVRDRLETMGFEMKSYSNPLATVHTVLRRLSESGEAEAHDCEGVKKFTGVVKKGYAIGIAIGKDTKEGRGVELVAGKNFTIGKDWKGVIGVGSIRSRKKS